MATESNRGRFDKTDVPCLYRFSTNGTYCALVKQYRQSLKTDDKTTAKRKLADFQRNLGKVDTSRRTMSMLDKCCSIAPYFKVSADNMDAYKVICEQMVTKASEEPGCLYYGFSFYGDQAHCREGYADAQALLAHIQNVGPLLEEMMKISELIRFEIHGPKGEVAKLQEPLSKLQPQFFVLEDGYRR